MALQRQTVVVPFSQGIDTKTDPKQVVMGKLLDVTNGVYGTPSAVSKRWGTVQRGATQVGALHLLACKDKLLAVNNSAMHVTSMPAVGNATNVGYIPSGMLSIASVVCDTNSNYCGDSARAAGFWLHAWVTTGFVLKYAIVEEATGSLLATGTLDMFASDTYTSRTQPRCVALGTNLYLFWRSSSGNIMNYVVVDTTQAAKTVSSPYTLTECDPGTTYDAVAIGTFIALAYSYTGSSTIRLHKITAPGTSTYASVSRSAGVIPSLISVFTDGAGTGNVILAWHQDDVASLYTAGYSSSLAELAAPAAHPITGTPYSITGVAASTVAGTYTLFICLGTIYGSALSVPVVGKVEFTSYTTDYPTTEFTELCRSARLVGRAFMDFNGAGVLLPLAHTYTDQLQAINFLYNASTGQWVARWNYGNAFNDHHYWGGAMLPEGARYTGADGYARWSIATVTQSIVELNSSAYNVGGLGLTTWIIDDERYNCMALEMASTLHISGLQLTMYDGYNFVEHGFYLYPEGITLAVTGGGAGTQAVAGADAVPNSYGYGVVYEWIDNLGQIHRSRASVIASMVMADEATDIGVAASRVTVTIPRLSITNKTGVKAVIFRTVKDGAIYYRLAAVNCDPTTGYDTVTYDDETTDADLSVRTTQIYETDGRRPNGCASPCFAPIEFQNRLVYIDSSNRCRVGFSIEIVMGNGGAASPVELPDEFSISVPEAGGPCTGLGVVDEKLIFFKKDRAFFLAGQLPDEFGNNGSFAVQQLQVGMGTVEPKSVVASPDGLFFRSEMGLAVMNRSLEASLIGYDVDGLLTGTVVSALVVPDQHHVRFTLSGTDVLVYDYLAKQWSRFSYSLANISAVMYGGVYTRLDYAGVVHQESKSTYADNGVFVPFSMTTSWLQFAQLQGFQRVRRALLVGECLGACSVNVLVYYDNKTPVAQTFASLAVTTATVPWKHRFDLAVQKCSALKMVISDAQSTDVSGGMFLSALAFEAALKQGTDKLPAAQAD